MATEIRTKKIEIPINELREVRGPFEYRHLIKAKFEAWRARVNRECETYHWKAGDLNLFYPEPGGLDYTVIGVIQITKEGDGYCNYCGASSADITMSVLDNGKTMCDMCKETRGD